MGLKLQRINYKHSRPIAKHQKWWLNLKPRAYRTQDVFKGFGYEEQLLKRDFRGFIEFGLKTSEDNFNHSRQIAEHQNNDWTLEQEPTEIQIVFQGLGYENLSLKRGFRDFESKGYQKDVIWILYGETGQGRSNHTAEKKIEQTGQQKKID